MNLGFSQRDRRRTKFLFTFISLLLLGISATSSYYIGLFRQKFNQGGSTFYISVVMAIVVFFFNYLMQQLLKLATKQQKLDTKTNLIVQNLYVIVIHQSLNLGFFSIAVPLIIHFPDMIGGLHSADVPTTMIIMMAFKAFINETFNFLYDYFEIRLRIYRILLKRNIIFRSQYKVNLIFRGIQLTFQSRCASIVQLFWFGLIFGVVSPFCIFISASGLLFMCLYERILFNSKYAIPRYTGLRLHKQFVNLLRLASLNIGVLNLMAHKVIQYVKKVEMQNNTLSIIIANIVIGGVFVLLPWDKILQKLNFSIESDADEVYGQHQFQIAYKEANPANSKTFFQYFNQKLIPKRRIPKRMYGTIRYPPQKVKFSDTDRKLNFVI